MKTVDFSETIAASDLKGSIPNDFSNAYTFVFVFS